MTNPTRGPGLSTASRAVTYGVLGGIMMIVLEFLVLAHTPMTANWIALSVQLMLQWIPAGIAIAALALRNDGRRSGVRMACLLVVFAAGLSAGIVGARETARAAGIAITAGPLTALPLLPSFLYTFWITLFYGGLFMAACAQTARAEWTRNALAQAEIERARSETLLGEAALRALKSRVDPDMLLRAVGEIARRYDTDPRGTDRLLDALIAFLRSAMAGVRDRPATLHGELGLAVAYAKLRAELEPDRPRWRVAGDPGPVDVPFPQFWITAALDRWSSLAAPGATCDVRVRATPADVSLTLDAPFPPGAWMATSLEHRLREELRSVFGDRATLVLRTAAMPGAPLLSLVLAIAPHPQPRQPIAGFAGPALAGAGAAP